MRPGEDSVSVDLDLDRRSVWTAVLVVALVNGAFLYATWLRDAIGPTGDLSGYVLRQLDVRTERSVAAWYSAVLLLAAGAAALLAFASDRLVGSRRQAPGRAWGWVLLAAGLAALSLDEVAALHESTGSLAPNPFEGHLDDWVGVLVLPLAAAALATLWFARAHVRPVGDAYALMLAGLALFASVPAQEQLQNWMREQHGGRPVALALLEEGAEVYGALAFVAAGLVYALRGRRAVRLSWKVSVGAARWTVAGAAVAIVGGTLAAEPGLEVLGLPFAGTPSGWFAGVGVLLAGVAALGVWRLRRGEPDGLAWLVAALVACVVATDLGSGRALTEQLWPGSPRRQLASRLALAVFAIGAAAALLAARRRPKMIAPHGR